MVQGIDELDFHNQMEIMFYFYFYAICLVLSHLSFTIQNEFKMWYKLINI